MKLLFDCDGTILDSMHIWIDPINDLLREYKYTLTKEEKGEIEALDITGMCIWLSEHIAKDKSPVEIRDGFDKIIYDAYSKSLMPKIGAKKIIEDLKKEGFTMVLASSTDVSLLEVALKRLGLYDYFEFILTPDSSEFNKGQKEFWELACEKLNASPNEVALFDDALYAIKSAKSIGIKTYGIKDFPYNQGEWEFIKKEADFVLDNIKDIDIKSLRYNTKDLK